LMPSAHTLAIGFIGLNSNLACWKPTVESNARSPAPICLTSLSVVAQIGWRMMAITPPGLSTRRISFTPGLEEATGNVQLKRAESDPHALEPNTIALVITEPAPKATVSLHVLDATSGAELARLDTIEMAIAI
jgi:hypothetical protein